MKNRKYNKNMGNWALACLMLLVILLAVPSAGLADMHPDYAYATLYPSSMYGFLERFRQEVEIISVLYPGFGLDGLLLADDFSIDEYGTLSCMFNCSITLTIRFEVDDITQKTSDWKLVCLDLRAEDIPTSSDGITYLFLANMALINAADPSLDIDEAASLLGILIQNASGAPNSSSTHKYNGFQYGFGPTEKADLRLAVMK